MYILCFCFRLFFHSSAPNSLARVIKQCYHNRNRTLLKKPKIFFFTYNMFIRSVQLETATKTDRVVRALNIYQQSLDGFFFSLAYICILTRQRLRVFFLLFAECFSDGRMRTNDKYKIYNMRLRTASFARGIVIRCYCCGGTMATATVSWGCL